MFLVFPFCWFADLVFVVDLISLVFLLFCLCFVFGLLILFVWSLVVYC